MTAPLLQVDNLVREYAMPREKLFEPPPKVHALNGVSFAIEAGRSLGIVGESGSGKSTLARLVMALDKPTAGSVSCWAATCTDCPPRNCGWPGATSRWCSRTRTVRWTRARPSSGS